LIDRYNPAEQVARCSLTGKTRYATLR